MSRITEVEDAGNRTWEDAPAEAREDAREDAHGEARTDAHLDLCRKDASRLERAWAASHEQIRRWARASASCRFLV